MIIEISLRALIWMSNILLGLTFFSAWFQHSLGPSLGFSSGLSFHLSLGVPATLLALFSNISSLFYFIGTGRWIKDQAESYLVRDKAKALRIWAIYESANKLKAGPMPLASLSIVIGLFTFIIGGALQVGAISYWVHPTLGTLLLLVNLLGQHFVFKAMRKNLDFLDLTSKEIDGEAKN